MRREALASLPIAPAMYDKNRWIVGFVAAALRLRRDLAADDATAAAEAMWPGASMLRPSDAAVLYFAMANTDPSGEARATDSSSCARMASVGSLGDTERIAAADLRKIGNSSRLDSGDRAAALATIRSDLARLRGEERQRKLVETNSALDAFQSLPSPSKLSSTSGDKLESQTGDFSDQAENRYPGNAARHEG